MTHQLKTYRKASPFTGEAAPNTGRSWFKATELAAIYGIPAPTTAPKVVGVISFGGGLYGSVDANGVLTNGDCQAYWTSCGIPTGSHPTVVVVPIGGATNNPTATDGSTDENTLDVETIGGCCPTSHLTIILYIAPNTLASFVTVINYALNTPVTVKGVAVTPTTLSISWGAPEIYYTNLATIDAVLATAVSRGINVTVATGDNGSNDGVGGAGNYCDFPSSSPNVIACGGTNLVCPNYVYDGQTVERAWSSTGGGVSRTFAKPSYQSALAGSYRKTPDISSVADPATPVQFYVNGNYVYYGGTSVSAPTIAGFFAACDAAVYANPRFYPNPSVFHDITQGSNGGYSASTGYDDCTGLGTLKGALAAATLAVSIPVTGVTVSPTGATLSPSQTQQITATVAPTNAANKAVTWSSSNTAVATVNSTGLVTAVAVGSATITVTTSDGSKTATAAITVRIPVTGVTLNSSSISIRKNDTSQLRATVAPSNATNKAVTWSSSNNVTATVNSSGLVTGRSSGTVTIRVTTADGSKTATCSVRVS